ncbi:alpha/beta hydrolase [Pyxidicoccus fallax]|uniref:Alpha/beta hydrolase n=1 Tax=Pyxidicoccus fallax TaxID=394095 RepID=A0A848LLI4_9BACT|nr:alpha/beta hydrolase [Pyxidicoccus fallax]NMO18618.1 alpha/beta hydrolase [Pyxidicoccus fallax]NPC79159.1 alpha/beta hydrolase [Pyxidicoccus fallax]
MTALTVLHLAGCLLLAAVFFAPPRSPALMQFFKGILREYSLLLLVPALLTALLAARAWRAGEWSWLRWSTSAAALLVLFAAAWPALSAWRMARTHGIPLSLRDYFRPLVGQRPPPSQTVRFATVEGVDLHADLFLPDTPASGPRPAVLYLHGGGWSGGERGYARAWADFFTSRGHPFISFDYRLFPPATGLKAPGDVQCGIGWVKAHAATYGIDPDRLVLFGESAGGHLATLAAYASGDPRLPPSCETGDTSVKAVISFYAPSDLVFEAEHLGPSTRKNLEGFTGVPLEGHRELYALLSPLTHVGPRSPPTLLLHGEADGAVPLHASRVLAARLAEAGVPHQLFTLPYAEHAFDVWDGGFGRQLARAVVERFLQRHVPVAGAGSGSPPG